MSKGTEAISSGVICSVLPWKCGEWFQLAAFESDLWLQWMVIHSGMYGVTYFSVLKISTQNLMHCALFIFYTIGSIPHVFMCCSLSVHPSL